MRHSFPSAPTASPAGGCKLARLSASFATVALLAGLAACGGGGGGGGDGGSPTPPPPPPPPPPPTSQFQPAQTTASTPTYTNAKLTAAYGLINEQRTAAGLGVLLQSGTLDQVADGHSNYLALNNDYGAIAGLGETPTAAGFVGATTAARLATAGFSGTATEVAVGRERVAVDGVRAALASPFRRLTLLDHGATDLGMGFVEPGATRPAGAASVVPENIWGAFVGTAGVRAGTSQQNMRTVAGGLSVYPPDAATDVPALMYREVPNPVQAELGDYGFNGLFPGYAVSLQTTSDKTLAVSTFTLVRVAAGGNTPVLAKLLDANDPIYLRPNNIKNWAVLIPLTALVPGATYQASVTGSASGAAFTKTWSFTTRSGFTVSAPVREAANLVTIRYASPSGILQGYNGTFRNCGGAYTSSTVDFFLGTQTVTLRERGVTPPAGCTVSLTVFDLGTATSDTREFPLN